MSIEEAATSHFHDKTGRKPTHPVADATGT
jgi:hypothetical protein